jgi:methyl-accepting chemotaxis protein
MRSADAAKNTAGLIEQSVANARNGVSIADEVGKVLKEITAASDKVNSLVSEIAAASSEQAKGIQQVNSAVGEMDKVTQSNAAAAEESAAASEQLSAQSEQVRGIVQDLTKLVGLQHNETTGAAGAPAQHKAAAAAVKTPPAAVKKVAAAAPVAKPVTKSTRPAPAAAMIPLDASEEQGDFSEFNKAA